MSYPSTIVIGKKAVDLIVEAEVSSRIMYDRKYCKPMWPGGDSGVTIGIGYDLGYNTDTQVKLDWGGYVTGNELALFLRVTNVKALPAKALLQANLPLQRVTIPYSIAYVVFLYKTLPRFIKSALRIYPGLENLAPDAVGALVSMVFNRGNSLVDNPNHPELKTRLEMRAIVPLVAEKDYLGIASQIDHSKRLWENIGMNGLITRRENEAAMVMHADRDYDETELFNIQLA